MRVIRLVTEVECPWLEGDVDEGTIVYRFKGYTYGAISPNGVAVTHEPETFPFFELPRNSVEE